uniref:Uncharacterized LOC115380997 n=1 Tax=Salarias fasciatus TaxID=181472 RepID=A0A672FUE4_SALFA
NPLVVSVVLVLGGLGGTATSDFQMLEKSLHRDKSLLSDPGGRHSVRRQPHQQMKTESRKSLGIDHLNIHVAPTTSRFSLPTIIKLFPPTARPLHMHANMPLRFGRDGNTGDGNGPNLTPNLPQRFGRAREELRVCEKCRQVREATNPVLPQRFGRNIPNWSLLRALASEQLSTTGLHWAEDFDFTSSSEENMEMQEKNF